MIEIVEQIQDRYQEIESLSKEIKELQDRLVREYHPLQELEVVKSMDGSEMKVCQRLVKFGHESLMWYARGNKFTGGGRNSGRPGKWFQIVKLEEVG